MSSPLYTHIHVTHFENIPHPPVFMHMHIYNLKGFFPPTSAPACVYHTLPVTNDERAVKSFVKHTEYYIDKGQDSNTYHNASKITSICAQQEQIIYFLFQ